MLGTIRFKYHVALVCFGDIVDVKDDWLSHVFFYVTSPSIHNARNTSQEVNRVACVYDKANTKLGSSYINFDLQLGERAAKAMYTFEDDEEKPLLEENHALSYFMIDRGDVDWLAEKI